MRNKGFVNIGLLVLFFAVVVGSAAYLTQVRRKETGVFGTQVQCQLATGKTCIQQLCQTSEGLNAEEQAQYQKECNPGWVPVVPSSDNVPSGSIDEQTCSQDSECVVVPHRSCCRNVKAVNVRYGEAYQNPGIQESPRGCEFVKCGLPPQNPVARCVSNQCILVAGANTNTWKTYRNEQYGFEFKYPDTWKIGSVASNRGTTNAENGTPIYVGQGESCTTQFELGAFDVGTTFYENKYATFSDIVGISPTAKEVSANQITILLGDFSNNPKIILDDLGGKYEFDVRKLESILRGDTQSPANSNFNRVQKGGRWAFYSPTYIMFGGPCDLDRSLVKKLHYASYEFLNNGKYIVFQVSTADNNELLFNSILSTFKFTK